MKDFVNTCMYADYLMRFYNINDVANMVSNDLCTYLDVYDYLDNSYNQY